TAIVAVRSRLLTACTSAFAASSGEANVFCDAAVALASVATNVATRRPARMHAQSRAVFQRRAPVGVSMAFLTSIRASAPTAAAASAATHATAAEIARTACRTDARGPAATEIARLRAAVGVERRGAALDRLVTRIAAAAKRLARTRIGRWSAPVLLRDALVAVRHAAAMVDVVPPVVVTGNVRTIESVVLMMVDMDTTVSPVAVDPKRPGDDDARQKG